MQNKDSEDRIERFARRQWNMADMDGDGSLSFKEILVIVQKLNIDLDKAYVQQVFEEVRDCE